MPTINISRTGGKHKKRDVSVFAARLTFEELATAGDTYQLTQFPKNAVAISGSLTTLVPFSVALSTIDIGLVIIR